MSNRNFDSRVIIQRLQNQVNARNLYLNNTNGRRIINNPQNSDGNASRFNLYIPGAQTEYFRGLIGSGETVSIGGIVNIPPFPLVPTSAPPAPIFSIIMPGLVLYYDFGITTSYSGSGTNVNDLSPSGYTGTLVNGPIFSPTNGGILVFNSSGTDNYIDTNHSIASESFTINCWFKTSDVTSVHILISKETVVGGPWNYRMFLDGNGYLIADIAKSNGDYAGIVYSQNLADDIWHCVSFSRDATTNTISLYVDGVQVETSTDTLTGSITNSQNVWIGLSALNPPGSYPFIGDIGSIFIYNRALTDSEVLTNFMVTKSRFGV
jgi:hypothetical protein